MSESSTSLVSVPRNFRRRYTMDFKRQVVQESMASGASIARVAMAHGLNANQLHNWRWQYRRGDFGPLTETPALLPVHINALPAPAPRQRVGHQESNNSGIEDGRIELHLGNARILVHGAVDLQALRCMIEMLHP